MPRSSGELRYFEGATPRSGFHFGRDVNPASGVATTTGCTPSIPSCDGRCGIALPERANATCGYRDLEGGYEGTPKRWCASELSMPSDLQMRLVERIPAAVLMSLSKSTFGSSTP